MLRAAGEMLSMHNCKKLIILDYSKDAILGLLYTIFLPINDLLDGIWRAFEVFQLLIIIIPIK